MNRYKPLTKIIDKHLQVQIFKFMSEKGKIPKLLLIKKKKKIHMRIHSPMLVGINALSK